MHANRTPSSVEFTSSLPTGTCTILLSTIFRARILFSDHKVINFECMINCCTQPLFSRAAFSIRAKTRTRVDACLPRVPIHFAKPALNQQVAMHKEEVPHVHVKIEIVSITSDVVV